jgi:predicted 3-demethylubiquinone-9 3-methyltransferase (glyoxalase superfamily)
MQKISMPKITPFLWFHERAEEAVSFYLSVFREGKILRITRWADLPPEERPGSWTGAGSVLTVEFELFGQQFVALNGGPHFTFNEAISFVVNCETQAEVDQYWDALTSDGGAPVQCGWLRDRFGVSWQIVPTMLNDLMASDDSAKALRATRAMLKMVKLDIATLEAAANA